MQFVKISTSEVGLCTKIATSPVSLALKNGGLLHVYNRQLCFTVKIMTALSDFSNQNIGNSHSVNWEFFSLEYFSQISILVKILPLMLFSPSFDLQLTIT